MFGFLKSKTESQRKSEALLKRAQSVWNYADLDKRTSLLGKVMNTQDDRLFLAYVHAAWSQIPTSDEKLKLVWEIMRREGNDEVASRAGRLAAQCFSAENFNILFGQKSFVEDWTFDDALGIWYCLGRLCFLIAIGSLIGLPKADVDHVVELGQKALMKAWMMSTPTLKRFETFNETKLAQAYSIYTSINDAKMFRRYFSLFVSEITGNDISFSADDFSADILVQLLAGQVIDMDPILHSTVSSMFVTTAKDVREQFRGYKV